MLEDAYSLEELRATPGNRLEELLECRPITPDRAALRPARYFGTSPQFWLNLQACYDLKIVER